MKRCYDVLIRVVTEADPATVNRQMEALVRHANEATDRYQEAMYLIVNYCDDSETEMLEPEILAMMEEGA